MASHGSKVRSGPPSPKDPGGAHVAVAIANWNGDTHVTRCLDAVFAQSHPPAEVVVVDNGSTDGSPDRIASTYPAVRLLRRKSNEGVCRGYNLAIQNSVSPFILILNTDVFLNRDFLCRALAGLTSAPDVGSVAAGVMDAATGRPGYGALFLRPWIGFVSDRRWEKGGDAFGSSGSALLCRREMLDDVALEGRPLDETLFAYLEDLDLAWRASLRRWRCVYVPDALARHIGSASMGGRVRVREKPAFFQRHIWKNRYLLLMRNPSFVELLVLAPWLALFELFTSCYLLLRSPNRLHVFLLAHLDALRLLPDTLRKRRWISSRRLLPNGRVLRYVRFW